MPMIKVQATVNRTLKDAWDLWTDPMRIIKWNQASPDWHTPYAENDVRKGGSFLCRMEAKDGSQGFDFSGTYTQVVPESLLEYVMADGRKVKITFAQDKHGILITEEFDPEHINPQELQRDGWQAILNNFKTYAETKGRGEMLRFQVKILATPATVYKRMLDDKTYREWTKLFNPTSHFVGSWDKGAMIRFIGVDPHGQKGGMVSRVRENILNRFVSLEH